MKPDLEHDDDAPVGRVLSRREVLGLLAGLGGVALLAAEGHQVRTRKQVRPTPTHQKRFIRRSATSRAGS